MWEFTHYDNLHPPISQFTIYNNPTCHHTDTASLYGAAPVHAIKAHRRSRGRAPLIFNLGTHMEVSSQFHTLGHFILRKETPRPLEAGWAPELAWMVLENPLPLPEFYTINLLKPSGNFTYHQV
jgi:hypothetical protein